MAITFNNYIYIYLFAYLALPLCIFYKIKILGNKSFNDNAFPKNHTDILRGIFIIIVVLAHTTARMPGTRYLLPLTLGGNLTNIIFLFLSGYCLMESLLNKTNYLKGFFSKKLVRVYVPFVIMNISLALFDGIVFKEYYAVKEFVVRTLLIKAVSNNSSLWYIIATLLLFTMFYISFKYLSKNSAMILMFMYAILYIIACEYLKLGVWWYNTAFCFPIGVFFSYNKQRLITIIKEKYSMVLLVALLGSVITFTSFVHNFRFNLIWNLTFTIFFILLIIIAMLKIELKSKIFTFIGGISYELYLVHMALLLVYFRIINLRESYSFYLFLVISIILSLGMKKITSHKYALIHQKSVSKSG